MNQSINESINQSINQSVDQWRSKQGSKKSVSQSINRSFIRRVTPPRSPELGKRTRVYQSFSQPVEDTDTNGQIPRLLFCHLTSLKFPIISQIIVLPKFMRILLYQIDDDIRRYAAELSISLAGIHSAHTRDVPITLWMQGVCPR